MIDNHKRWIEEPIIPFFSKGKNIRLNYTVNARFYDRMTRDGNRTYDTWQGKYMPHQGDDMVALDPKNQKYPKATYQWKMPFESMKFIGQADIVTNTLVFHGYDAQGNIHELRAAHCIAVLVKVGDVIKKGQCIATVSDKGVEIKGNDNSHLHITYKVNGAIRSLAALLFGLEPMPVVRASKEEFAMASFINGYQRLAWLNQTVHVYKQSGKEKLGLWALPYGEVMDITKVQIPGKKIKCITNANFYNRDGTATNEILGGYQGLNCNESTLGPDDVNFVGYKNSKCKPFIDVAIYSDGRTIAGDFNSWEHRGSDILVRSAPGGVQLNNGVNVNMYSPGSGYSKITTATQQTFILKNADGTFSLAVVEGKLSPLTFRNFSKAYGCLHQSSYDGGSSSQMLVNGEKKLYTGNDVPCFFVIYEDEEAADQEEKQEEPSVGFRTVKCVKGTLDNGTAYPTRKTIYSEWDRTGHKIKVGDKLIFDDVKPINGRPDCYFQIVGGDRPDLIGRWFAYDKNYFD